MSDMREVVEETAAEERADLKNFMHESLDAVAEARRQLWQIRTKLFPREDRWGSGDHADANAAFEHLKAADEALCKILPGAEPMRRKKP